MISKAILKDSIRHLILQQVVYKTHSEGKPYEHYFPANWAQTELMKLNKRSRRVMQKGGAVENTNCLLGQLFWMAINI